MPPANPPAPTTTILGQRWPRGAQGGPCAQRPGIPPPPAGRVPGPAPTPPDRAPPSQRHKEPCAPPRHLLRGPEGRETFGLEPREASWRLLRPPVPRRRGTVTSGRSDAGGAANAAVNPVSARCHRPRRGEEKCPCPPAPRRNPAGVKRDYFGSAVQLQFLREFCALSARSSRRPLGTETWKRSGTLCSTSCCGCQDVIVSNVRDKARPAVTAVRTLRVPLPPGCRVFPALPRGFLGVGDLQPKTKTSNKTATERTQTNQTEKKQRRKKKTKQNREFPSRRQIDLIKAPLK